MPKEEDEEDGLLTPKQLAELAELINNQLARHWLDDKRVQVVRLSVQGCDSTIRRSTHVCEIWYSLFG